jgi:hypothetical protein
MIFFMIPFSLLDVSEFISGLPVDGLNYHSSPVFWSVLLDVAQ